MKNIYIAIMGVFTLLTLSSCGEDYLNLPQQGSIGKVDLENAAGAEMFVTAAYANLTENSWGASIFNWAMGGMYGGDANKGSDAGDQSVLNEMELYNTLSSNSYLNDKWVWTHKGSQRVSIALQTLAKITDMDASIKAIRVGEMRFLRAMFYFESVKVFGPYILYFDETHTESHPVAHNDQDIYPMILADVDAAIAALPETQPEVGRVNVWAAKALKAKILMQKGDLAAAQPILKDVIDNGKTSFGKKYALADNMNQNWDSFQDNTSPESIWEIQFSVDGPNDNANQGMSLCYPHNAGPGGCCGFYQPSYELVNSYQVNADGLPYLNGEYRTKKSVTDLVGDNIVNDANIAVDPRLDFAVGRVGIPYKDYGITDKGWIRNIPNGGIFLPKKHVYSKAEADAGLGKSGYSEGWAPGSAMNLQYLSLRDIKLLYAECLAEAGNLAGAMAQVNDIRTRAALPVNRIKNSSGQDAATYNIALYPSSHAAFADKAVCVKAIRMERKLELAMEGQRAFDLFRWGGTYMAAELNAYVDYEAQYIGKFTGASKLSADKTMFPVPNTQIQIMGKDENGKPYLVQPAPWEGD